MAPRRSDVLTGCLMTKVPRPVALRCDGNALRDPDGYRASSPRDHRRSRRCLRLVTGRAVDQPTGVRPSCAQRRPPRPTEGRADPSDHELLCSGVSRAGVAVHVGGADGSGLRPANWHGECVNHNLIRGTTGCRARARRMIDRVGTDSHLGPPAPSPDPPPIGYRPHPP